MPSTPLPADNSLDDPQVSTGDFQDGIGKLLDFNREFEQELDDLTSTTIREGAVRPVGNDAGGLYARGDLDAEVVFDNPSGQTSVAYSELSDSSDGWYVVQHHTHWTMIYIGEDYSSDEYSVMSKLVLTGSTMTFTTLRIFGTNISSLNQQLDFTNNSTNSFLNYIFKVLKV